jgi:hypothetical protein
MLNTSWGRPILLFLLSFAVLFNSLEAGTKQGAMIVVQKNNGHQIQGELIAVRKKSLILLNSESGVDTSIDVSEIEIIHILKGPKTGLGAISGFLVGGAVGTVAAGKSSNCGECPNSISRNILGGVLLGGFGALIGALIGSTAGNNEIIIFQGLSQEELDMELGKLRSKARIRDYQ